MSDLTMVQFLKTFPEYLLEQDERAGLETEERRLFAQMLRNHRVMLAIEFGALAERFMRLQDAIGECDALIERLEAGLDG